MKTFIRWFIAWVICMAIGLVLISLISIFEIQKAEARTLWEDTDKGFALDSGGWLDQDVFPSWLGVKCGLIMPEQGWMEVKGEGALEIYFPGIGWLPDEGIIFMHGCSPDPESGRDTKGGTCGINADFACHNGQMGGRIFMIVRVRKFFPRRHNIPTKARWVNRKVMYDVED